MLNQKFDHHQNLKIMKDTKKAFDSVKFMRQQRDLLSEKLSKMTEEEIVAYFQKKSKVGVKPSSSNQTYPVCRGARADSPLFFPADIHGKIPQIKKNKSACLFCVDQREKIIPSDFYWEKIAPKERHYSDPG